MKRALVDATEQCQKTVLIFEFGEGRVQGNWPDHVRDDNGTSLPTLTYRIRTTTAGSATVTSHASPTYPRVAAALTLEPKRTWWLRVSVCSCVQWPPTPS